MLFYNTILFMYHRALAPCTHYEDERCKLFIERTPRTILLWQLISLLTSTILLNINHLFVYSYIYAICIFFFKPYTYWMFGGIWTNFNLFDQCWRIPIGSALDGDLVLLLIIDICLKNIHATSSTLIVFLLQMLD